VTDNPEMDASNASARFDGPALAGRLLGQPEWLFLLFACSYVQAAFA
jgi:hypothetical protein